MESRIVASLEKVGKTNQKRRVGVRQSCNLPLQGLGFGFDENLDAEIGEPQMYPHCVQLLHKFHQHISRNSRCLPIQP